MDRKQFLKTCAIAGVAGSAISVFLESCASVNYFAKTSMVDNRIGISKSEFIQVKNEKTINRSYVLVKSDRFNYPIIVYRKGSTEYSALLMECTHKGCELQPQKNFLVCPCHGSEFSDQGVVQNPPAERDLQTFNVTSDDETIYIQL